MPNWSDVLKNIQRAEAASRGTSGHDVVRRRYLLKLHKHTGRNVIAYYSGWLSKQGIAETGILDEDKNGFMMAIHKMDRSKGLDLLLHTPGGDLAATESIIDYLRQMFGRDIRAIVPQLAMSGGTVIACACKEIVMGTHSNLGPIDPQLRGLPAHGIIAEFQRAYDEIQIDPGRLVIWQPILNKYHPTFLSQCENAIAMSKELARNNLEQVMFYRDVEGRKNVENIVKELNDYSGNKSHARHIHRDQCKKIGLKILDLEADEILQDLVLTVHHAYMHTLMNTAAFKMVENHLGVALVKQRAQQIQQIFAPAQASGNPS